MVDSVYHIRRKEKEIHDRSELLHVLSKADYVTVAMCKENEPYLVTVNHSFDPKANAVYFHCASVGKKIDFLRDNPRVCGEAIEDRGYVEGKCDYDYRSVHFYGQANQVDDLLEKRHALNLMIDKLEKAPEPSKKDFIDQDSLVKIVIFRIDIDSMTGKKRLG